MSDYVILLVPIQLYLSAPDVSQQEIDLRVTQIHGDEEHDMSCYKYLDRSNHALDLMRHA